MRSRLPLATIALTLAITLWPAAALGRGPAGFVGVVVNGPMFNPRVNVAHEFDRMVASGVQNIRMPFDWEHQQPYANDSLVPADQRAAFQDVHGVPTRFDNLDLLVAAAASRGISLLPVVQYAPEWAARYRGDLTSPPASPTPYANFVNGLVHRYGPGGTFWSEHPHLHRVPIRMWQIWNEPESPLAWHPQSSHCVTQWTAACAAPYVQLVRAARSAIRAADPHGLVVLGGLPNFSWEYLAQIYKVRGARHTFDVVAVHPYTKDPQGLITIMRRVRTVMRKAGDGAKPMMATETGWPSAQGKTPLYGFETTQAGQAKRTAELLPLLARYRRELRLVGFDYYTWMSSESSRTDSFDYAGLLGFRSGRVFAKPALRSFARSALSIEGCRRKGPLATDCVR